MEINLIRQSVQKKWDDSAVPALMDYIRIPAISPAYAPDWQANLKKAILLAENWCKTTGLKQATIKRLEPRGKTPALLITIQEETTAPLFTTLIYGHLDKQPESKGWDIGKGPWQPVIEGNRLFGRGSVDDGYALFSSIIAVQALQEQNIAYGRIVILIETGEESGSPDLPFYLETCDDLIGTPDLVVCLDSGCGDWERLWVTTSLRGYIGAQLSVSLLTQDLHSGASNFVASNFRILRMLLDRIEETDTGEIRLKNLHTDIPAHRLDQIRKATDLLGPGVASNISLVPGGRPTKADTIDLFTAMTWQPSLTVTGVDGLPPMKAAANVLNTKTSLALSFRIPPKVDVNVAARDLKAVLEADPPYNAQVRFTAYALAMGWDMPDPGDDLEKRIRDAATVCFGTEPAFKGEGGTIPFMNLLSEKFPCARFLVTGALGPHANAHGPNEFLDLPYVKKLTAALALIMARN